MRMLAVALLALAFAQPYFERENARKLSLGSHVSVFFDNSYSAQNLADGKKIFDIQSRFVEKITEIYPKTTAFQLLDNNFEGGASSFYDKSKLTDKLGTLTYSPLARNLKTVGGKQISALNKAGADKTGHIFWISDFQKTSVGKLEDLTFDTAKMYFIIPVLPTQNNNIYTDSIWLDNPFVRVGANNILNVRVRNISDGRADDKNLRLLMDGKQVATGVTSIEPHGESIVKMNFSLTEGGTKSCVLQSEDFPLIFDNEHFFTIKAAPKIKVCLISDIPNSLLEKAYQNEELFDLKTFSFGNIDFNRLQNSDLIVFENIKNADNALVENILQASEKGVNMAIFPDKKCDLTSLMRVFGFSAEPSGSRDALPLAVPNLQNPFFDGVFENLSSTMNMPNVIPNIKIFGGNKILKSKNDETFFAQFSKKNASVYVFAASTDATEGNFPLHALFVPVAYKMALNSALGSERLYWNFSDNFALADFDSLERNDMIKLRASDGREFIPSQTIEGTKIRLEIPHFGAEAGIFEVVRKSDNKKIGLIAFNTDKKESLTEYFSSDELKSLAEKHKNVKIITESEPESFVAAFKEDNISHSLWRYFILAALTAFLFETLIIRFWKS